MPDTPSKTMTPDEQKLYGLLCDYEREAVDNGDEDWELTTWLYREAVEQAIDTVRAHWLPSKLKAVPIFPEQVAQSMLAYAGNEEVNEGHGWGLHDAVRVVAENNYHLLREKR